MGYVNAALLAAVVEIVRVATPDAVPLTLTELVDPKLNVGRYWAPVGLEVRFAASATLPLNPPVGVTEMVDVFPVVAPGATVTVVPPIANLALTAVVTVTGAVPVVAL